MKLEYVVGCIEGLTKRSISGARNISDDPAREVSTKDNSCQIYFMHKHTIFEHMRSLFGQLICASSKCYLRPYIHIYACLDR
jgi:hypothetical protein